MESGPKVPDRALTSGPAPGGPPLGGPLPSDARASRFFQALGDPTRLAVVRLLRARERTVGELVDALGVPQPKVSRHLKVLRDAGLVASTKEGRIVRCRLSSPKFWPAEGRAWIDSLATGNSLVEQAGASVHATRSRTVPSVGASDAVEDSAAAALLATPKTYGPASSSPTASRELETHLL